MLYQHYVPRQRPENLLIRVGLWVGQKQVSTRCNEPKQQRERGEEMNAKLRTHVTPHENLPMKIAR